MKKLLSLAATVLVAMTANAALDDNNPGNNDYIKEWGRLKVQGTHIVSEKGEQIQIKGWSSFGWQNNWGDCHSEGAIKQMKAWGANIYRGAMYVEEGGYNNDKNFAINFRGNNRTLSGDKASTASFDSVGNASIGTD